MPKRLAGSNLRLITFGVTLLIAILVLDVAASFAQNARGTVPTVPPGVSGYTVTIDQDWLDSYSGLNPIRVTVQTNPAKATAKAERFVVRLKSRQYRTAERVTTTELVIPAGQKSGTAEIYVHGMAVFNSYDCQIQVLRGRNLLMQENCSVNNWVSHPKILVISEEFPEQRTSQTVCYKGKTVPVLATGQVNFKSKKTLPSFGYLSSIYNTNFGAMLGNAQQPFPTTPRAIAASKVSSWQILEGGAGFHYSRFADLPRSWIGLEGIDIIMIPLDQFKSLTSTNELQRSNLENWVTAGGALVVYDTGPKFKKADQVWPLLLGSDRDFVTETNKLLWRVPSLKFAKLPGAIDPSRNHSINSHNDPNNLWMSPDQYEFGDIAVSKWQQYPSPRKFPKSTPFGISAYLDGSIVAVDSDMSKWNQKDWLLLHNSIVTHNLILGHRVAANEIGSKSRGIDFQIPGVGEPPVKSFQVLIGMFLLFAGPFMVILLKRTEQMQYLFVAIPLLSAAVCSSLFLYAIIVDGSNRWGRCNSVTHLDHQTSRAVTHTRASYYCGRHPGVYEFSADGLGTAYHGLSNPSQVEFKKGSMRLSGGDIAARMPHEVTSVRPYETTNRLLVLPGKSGKQEAQSEPPPSSDTDTSNAQSNSSSVVAPRVQNRLGADVMWAVIRTEDGYFVVQDLPVGQTVDSTVSKIKDEVSLARALVHELSPQRVGSTYPRSNRNINNWQQPNFNSYGLATSWGEDFRIFNMIKRGKLHLLLDRPNSYVAIMEEFPMADEQLEPVQYKMQLHVVRGQW